MLKTKAKPSSFRRIRLVVYAVLWMVTMTIAPVLRMLTPEQAMLFPTVLGAFLAALAQAYLTERFLKRSMRGWVVYSMIGTLIVLLVYATPSLWNPQIRASVTLRSLMIMLPVPLLQALWLQRRVHKAWSWPVAQLVILIGNTLLIRRVGLNTSFEQFMLTRLYALLCGSLMGYLWMHPKDPEKAKLDVASESDDKRIQRLQEWENNDPLWDIDDQSRLQSKA